MNISNILILVAFWIHLIKAPRFFSVFPPFLIQENKAFCSKVFLCPIIPNLTL